MSEQHVAEGQKKKFNVKANLPWMVSGVLAAALVTTIVAGNLNAESKQAVATVNGEKITQGQLYTNMKQQYGTDSLTQMINQVLIEQEATKKKVTVSEKELNAEIKKIKSQFADDAAFKDSLKQYNMELADLEKQLKTQILLEKLLKAEITITDAELKTEFEKQKKEKVDAGQIRASHILVDTEADAKTALADLKDGIAFADVAKGVSKDGSAASGGDLGYFTAADMVKEFSTAAFALKKGEISGIVKSEFGYHIIMVTDVPSQWTLAEKKAEIEESLRATKLNDAAPAFVEKLNAKAKITKTLNKK